MSDLQRYIEKRKARDKEFRNGFDFGYEEFKIGILLKMARQEAGLTQEELAKLINTKKASISRIENHAKDIKLSTLKKIASALGKKLRVELV